MRLRLAPALAAVSVLGFLGWMILSDPDASDAGDSQAGADSTDALHQAGTQRSAVPCDVPLRWRVARIDDEFGLDTGEATDAVRAAAAVWEEHVDAPLFQHDTTGGFPIRLVFDERQERTQERIQREEDFQRERRQLERQRAELEEQRRMHDRLQDRYEERMSDFQRRLESYNATVRRWNERGGAPETVLPEMRQREEALEDERGEVEALEREVEASRRALNDAEERFSRRVEAHNRRADALERAFGPVAVESGLYREAVHTENDRVASVQREIRIYRFDDLADLQLVVAHELGHALGLGHADASGALMSAEYGRDSEARTVTRLQSADVELLRSRCPDL